MKLEIVELKLEGGHTEKKLTINGEIDYTTAILASTIFIGSEQSLDVFCSVPSQDIMQITKFLNINIGNIDDIQGLKLPLNVIAEFREERAIDVMVPFDLLFWKRPFSIRETTECFKRIYADNTDVHVGTHNDGDGLCIRVPIMDVQKPFGNYYNLAVNTLLSGYLLSIEILSDEISSQGLTTIFQFPKSIQAVCNQYLMYFGQFLSDLGLESEISVKQKKDHVLFHVMPKDKQQAIEKIYDALSVFLQAPEHVDELKSSDIALSQWKMNVYHLKSQLELSSALIQAKDATIQAQSIAIYQLKTMVVNQTPLENFNNSGDKEEKLAGGIISIGKFHGKGFSINLAEILRMLKRTFS